MKFKGFITKALIAASITFGGIALYANKHHWDPRLAQIVKQEEKKQTEYFVEIPPKHSKEELEKIILKENTPKDAFDRITKDISFIHHKYNGEELKKLLKTYPGKGSLERWYSLQELYSIGAGVCIDGDIGFCALLSDNPKYECKLLILKYKEIPQEKIKTKETLDKFCNALDGQLNQECQNLILTLLQINKGHAVGVFKKDGKFGYASFNDGSTGKDTVFKETKDSDFQRFIINNFSNYEKFGIVKIDSETMKFGKGIRGKKLEKKIEYFKMKSLLNEMTAGFQLKVEK